MVIQYQDRKTNNFNNFGDYIYKYYSSLPSVNSILHKTHTLLFYTKVACAGTAVKALAIAVAGPLCMTYMMFSVAANPIDTMTA